LLRPPRNIRKDRLVDTKLIFHAYFYIGLLECFLSFTMAFWYMERKGVPFSEFFHLQKTMESLLTVNAAAMWLKFGNLDPQYDPDYVAAVTNEASSIYFVTLVVMQLFNLLATRTRRLSLFQQPPIFNKETQNYLLFPAMVFAIVIAFICKSSTTLQAQFSILTLAPVLYIPGLQSSILTTRVPVEHWFLPAAFGLGLLILDEGRKYVVRTYPKSFLAKIAW
jgi:sodium/potassium-transporting ATPase subunit alpha